MLSLKISFVIIVLVCVWWVERSYVQSMNSKTTKEFEPDFDNIDGWENKKEITLLSTKSRKLNRKRKKGKEINLKQNNHRAKELEETLQERRTKLASRFGPRLANLAQVFVMHCKK